MKAQNNWKRRSKNTWADAAYKILLIENKPLGPTDIANLILANNLLESKNKSPATAVYIAINSDMKRKGSRSKFVKVGQKFGLSEKADKYVETSVHSRFRGKTEVEFWRRYHFKEKSDKELLTSTRQMIQEIHDFLNEGEESAVDHDQLCFWVWFCYNMQLYDQGALVFKRIDSLKASPILYKLVKRIGNMCQLRRG